MIAKAVGAFVLASLAAVAARVVITVVGIAAVVGFLPEPILDVLLSFPVANAAAVTAFVGTLGVIYR